MATKTTNYGLTKPDGADFYDVDVQNDNMDIIDKQMKANANDIAQLNSELEFDSHSAGGIEITLNKNVAMIMIYKSGNLTGGNTDQILCNIPDNGRFVRAIFAPCEVLSYNWKPIGNTGYVTFEDNTIKIRCKDSINDGVVVANLMIPRHIIQFD